MRNIYRFGEDFVVKKELEATQKMATFPEANYVATSTGDHMIMAEIWTKDGKELMDLITKRMGKIEGIKKICPAIILEKLKE